MFHWLVFWTGNCRLYLLMYTVQSTQKCPVHSTIHLMVAISTEWKTIWLLTTLLASCTPSHTCVLWLQSGSTLCDPINCSQPGSPVHGILQARILERVAMPSSRVSSQPRERIRIFWVSCIADWFFTAQPLRKPHTPPHATFNDNLSNVMLFYPVSSQQGWYLCVQVCEYHSLRIPFWGSLLRPT